MNDVTCGDNGGVTSKGTPCGATMLDETGRCQHHPAEKSLAERISMGTQISDVIDKADEDGDEVEALRRQLDKEKAARAAAEAALEEAEEAAARFNPTFDISNRLFESAEDVRRFFDPAHMREIAQQELAALNRNRLRRGFDRIEWTADEYEVEIQKVADKMATERQGLVPTVGSLTRVLKFYNPKSGNLIQVPVEDQVNNHKGSIADSVERYRRKGFKLPKPLLCATRDCWEPAEVNTAGEFTMGGYCSPDHQRRTEAGKERTEGVTTRQMINA